MKVGDIVSVKWDFYRSQIPKGERNCFQITKVEAELFCQLYPSVLDDLGLVASLRGLCEEFSERAKDIKLKFAAVSPTGSVPREIASCLYRVAREILQNVAKHASAKHVSVTLTLKNRTVVLSIADDGVGFDPEAVKGRGGLGLVGMEERVRLVKGKLSIAARPGHGTRIVITVPLPDGT